MYTACACTTCGRIYIKVTRGYAEVSVKTFNDYFDKAPCETQAHFGRRASMDDYLYCHKCNGQTFRDTTEEELKKIYGCTMSPIIFEKEND